MSIYTSLFADGEVLAVDRYGVGGTGAEGTIRRATFSIAGQQLICIDSSEHHDFTFTPSMSLYVECDTEAEIDRLCRALSDGGQVFMPLDSYGFGAKFAWVSDRFGVAWQLNVATADG